MLQQENTQKSHQISTINKQVGGLKLTHLARLQTLATTRPSVLFCGLQCCRHRGVLVKEVSVFENVAFLQSLLLLMEEEEGAPMDGEC
jgi:hypothetical protein